MWAFLQTYGIWIVSGVFFLLMLRMHAGGGGCDMGHSDHQRPTSNRSRQDDRQDEAYAEARPTVVVQDDAWQTQRTSAEPITTNHRSRGCH